MHVQLEIFNFSQAAVFGRLSFSGQQRFYWLEVWVDAILIFQSVECNNNSSFGYLAYLSVICIIAIGGREQRRGQGIIV